MLLNKARMNELIRRYGITLDDLAHALGTTEAMAVRMIRGYEALDYRAAKGLMQMLGLMDFAYVADDGEVMRIARGIARTATATC